MIKEDLISKITEANEAYRLGNPIISDPEWDELIEELAEQDSTHELLQEVGYIAEDDDRKEKLAHEMRSMHKCKTPEELAKWIKKYSLENQDFILTPKFDGCSILAHEITREAHTRGDGEYGQRSHKHFKAFKDTPLDENLYTYGEAIMPRERFEDEKYEDDENPRNTVAGILNKPDVTEKTYDVDYVRYGIIIEGMGTGQFITKEDVLIFLNERQDNEVDYVIATAGDFSVEFFKDLFEKWNQKYEIDGIIVEVNSILSQQSIGRERNGNPAFARAYKGDFEEVKETIVTGIKWQISKKGLVKPVMQIEATRLDGATVTNVTGNNAKFMEDNNIGIGTKMTVKRSGMVIPKVVEILDATGFDIDQVSQEVGVGIEWNDNHVELVTTEETSEQQVQFLTSFFKILEVENVSEGTCKMFFDAGYDDIYKILRASKSQFEAIDRFGSRKAEIVYNEIHSKMKNVELSKLQHASGKFNSLGSKKLLLLEGLKNPTIDDICQIEGFSDISANAYLEGVEAYKEFVVEIGELVTINETEKKEVTSNVCDGLVFVFTGVRRKDLESIIETGGGKIASGVSAKVTHLVCKDKNAGSSKLKKAESLGITIFNVEELEKELGV